MRFCPTCSNSENDARFYGNYCEACMGKRIFTKLDDSVKASICGKCGRIKGSGFFHKADEKGLETVLSERFRGYRVKVLGYSGLEVSAEFSAETGSGEIAVNKEVRLELSKVTCEKCYRKSCGYYEAVMQLRGSAERIRRYEDKICRKAQRDEEFVTKVEENDGGIDIYLSSKKVASAILSEMGIKPIRSYTLSGLKNGRKIYKNTYAIHLW